MMIANQKCQRCGKMVEMTTMSRFNTDILCMDCIEEERKHPLYPLAAQKELEALKRGEHNFPGIGWPPIID